MRGRLAAAVCGMMLLTACGIPLPLHSEPDVPDIPDDMSVFDEPTETGMPEPETTAANPIPLSAENHVTDECGVLDAEALIHYNEYLTNLANSRQIYTAAVITDSLNGQTPEQFAAAYYRDAFGTDTSGFLLLINNDTGEDVYHLEGVCAEYMTGTALPLAQATPYLVEGDYPAALDILLALGECVPEAAAS